MNEEAKKVIADLIRKLADVDSGNLLALQLVIEAFIDSGALNKKILLAKIDEANQKFQTGDAASDLKGAVLQIAHQLDPEKYPAPEKSPLLEFLEAWSPDGSKH